VTSADRTGFTRRTLLARAGAATAAAYLIGPGWSAGAPASAQTAAPLDLQDAGYWSFADRMQGWMESAWTEWARAYGGPSGGTSTNANMLFAHAAAARAGHIGPARQDARARALAAHLCETPPWRPNMPGSVEGCPDAQPPASTADDQTHACGWGGAMNRQDLQHVVIDTAVVRGLAEAYRAREALALSDQEAAQILDRIHKAADSTFYAYPSLRLNQINWPVEIYAQAVSVLGDTHLLRHDCRLQLSRFADAITHPAPGERIPNMGPGYRFHYLPQSPAGSRWNLDSAEYANIVCAALLFYGQARRRVSCPGLRSAMPAWRACP